MAKFSFRTARSAVEKNYPAINTAPDTDLPQHYPSAIQRSYEVITTEKVSEAIEASIRARLSLLDRTDKDKVFRAEALDRCRQRNADGTIYFVNNWCWTQDPRIVPTTIPFNLFPKQEEYIRWRWDRRINQENGLVIKSRDAGLTWLNCVCQLHSWLFEPGYKGSIGSRKEMLVDRIGDPDSIFEKIRILLRCLPDWMVPSYQENYLKFINDDNGSTITGEAGKNLGRGGRSTVYDVDEAAFVEQGNQVDSALSENTRVIIWTSTVNLWNPANIFAQKVRKGTIPTFRFHWRDDPRKDDAWYEQRKATLDALIVASEIDMDDNASGEDAIIPAAWVRAAMDRWVDRGLRYSAVGVDVSRGGSDNTVIVGRFSQWCDRLRLYPGSATPDGDIVAKRVVAAMTALPDDLVTKMDWPELQRFTADMQADQCAVHIDIVGVGSSPYDRLKSLKLKYLFGLSSGERAVDVRGKYKTDRTGKLGFYNKRAEWWWNMRELLDPNYGSQIELPPDEELAAELSTPRWAPVPVTDPDRISPGNDPDDRIMSLIRVESKDDIKKRIGGRSPDRADAVVYAFAEMDDRKKRSTWLSNL